MTVSSLFFLLGVVAVQQLPALPQPFILVLLAVLALLLGRARQWPPAFFAAGLLWAALYAGWRLADRLPAAWSQQDIEVSGYIAGLPQIRDKHADFDFTVTAPDHDFPEKIRLSWTQPPTALAGGQGWRLTVRLKAPHGRMNPGGFDYETWLFANHIGATGYVRNRPAPAAIAQPPTPARLFAAWRQAVADRLDRALPAGQQTGMIKALTVGSQTAIGQAQWQVFNTTGTTHLVVISGSHIGLIAGLVFLLARHGWARLAILEVAPQTVAAGAAWLAALFYAGLAGYSTPTLRAVIMLSVALAAIAWQRHTAPLQVLLLALLAVLIYDPLAVLALGFWLSFAAVGLLLYVSAGRLSPGGGWLLAGRAQWTTSIGLAPLLIVFFQQVSLISPLANWLAAPIIEIVIVPLLLLAIPLLFLLPVFAKALLYPADLALHAVWKLLEWLAGLPLVQISCLPPPWYAVAAAVPGVLLLLAPRGFPGRYLSIFLLLPLLSVQVTRPAPGSVWLTLLDVGQGLAAVIRTSEHTLLFDAGGKFGATTDMGEDVVLPFLRSQGIVRLDTLLISHDDNDHSGGAGAVLAGLPVAAVIGSTAKWAQRERGQYCRAGQAWQWDGVEFKLLSPPEPGFAGDNNNACVLWVGNGRHSFLLPADIERQTEAWLVTEQSTALRSNVLVAPHHGSRTSSSPAFLQAVSPELIAIPVGYRNRFHFPHREVLDRYRQLGIPWLSSGDSGAIDIRAEAGNADLQVTHERERHRRYWLTTGETGTDEE